MTAALRILSPGVLATIQDLGRPSFQHLGVPVSGALDAFSLRLGNVLLRNDPGAAALEMCYSGLQLEAAHGPVQSLWRDLARELSRVSLREALRRGAVNAFEQAIGSYLDP